MQIGEGIMVGLFVMALVVGLLGSLYLLIRLTSLVIQHLTGKAAKN